MQTIRRAFHIIKLNVVGGDNFKIRNGMELLLNESTERERGWTILKIDIIRTQRPVDDV